MECSWQVDDADRGESIAEALHARLGHLAAEAHFLADDLDCPEHIPTSQRWQLSVTHILQNVDCLRYVMRQINHAGIHVVGWCAQQQAWS